MNLKNDEEDICEDLRIVTEEIHNAGKVGGRKRIEHRHDTSQNATKKLKNGEDELFHQLKLFHNRHVDSKSVIETIRRYPTASNRLYNFEFEGQCSLCYPLHHAIKTGAPCDVLDALYRSFPSAIKKKVGDRCDTALHIAVTHGSSPDVVSFLLEKWPIAVSERNQKGNQPLHSAVIFEASLEVVSLLINKWSGSIKEEGEHLATPLHLACGGNESTKMISLLVNKCSDVAKGVDECGMTPLHIACQNNLSLELIVCLLEKWPKAMKEKNCNGETPLAITKRVGASKDVLKLLSYALPICNKRIDHSAAKEMIDFFIEMQWRAGVVMVLDRCHTAAQSLDFDIKALPTFLSFVGNFSRVETMWGIFRSQQKFLCKF